MTPGSANWQYTYNGFGQRLLKSPAGAATETLYQYDPGGHLLEESSVSGGSASAQLNYVYLDDKPVALLVPSTGALSFIHGDRLDTPQIVTGSDQSVAWMAAYQPFGQTQILVNGLAQNLRFPGQYADAETGYYHNGFRDYDPTLGRYLESDPIGLIGGLNTYAYVRGNPISRTDPFGLQLKLQGHVEYNEFQVTDEIGSEITVSLVWSVQLPERATRCLSRREHHRLDHLLKKGIENLSQDELDLLESLARRELDSRGEYARSNRLVRIIEQSYIDAIEHGDTRGLRERENYLRHYLRQLDDYRGLRLRGSALMADIFVDRTPTRERILPDMSKMAAVLNLINGTAGTGWEVDWGGPFSGIVVPDAPLWLFQ